jgi:hypothetical protein
MIREIVTIWVEVSGAAGEYSYFLQIERPDGSVTEEDLGSPGPGTYYLSGTATPPPGPRTVLLYESPPPGPVQASVVVATCYFAVIGGPADLVVAGVGVSPRNPHQEDMVSFSAQIANAGGTDANGFLIEVYLDGYLWDSSRSSLPAGSGVTYTSDHQYQAEDGPHEIRWVLNSDRRVEESDYSNNEGRASFYVSPRTVTLTEHATITKTKIQTEKQTLTITTTRTLTRTRTTDTSVQSTITANQVVVTSTLTGLATPTVYSPTVTITVAAAQMISNPLLWLALGGTLAMMGAVLHLPKNGRLKRFYRRFTYFFPLSGLLAWLTRREVRKAFVTTCLILVVVLSIMSQVGQQASASTVTATRTVTSTEWITLTQSLTSTRYITSTTTDTSTFTRTSTGLMTTTPTITATVDHRSTVVAHLPTTIYTTARQGPLSIEFSVLDSHCGNEVLTIVKGTQYCLKVVVRNPSQTGVDISLDTNVRFDGDPSQLIASDGTSWSLDARPHNSEESFSLTAPAGGTASTDGSIVVFRWNWIPPVSKEELSKKLLWNTVVKVINIIVSKVGLPGVLDFLYSAKRTSELMMIAGRALAERTFFENYVYEASGSSSNGQALRASSTVEVRVSDQSKGFFVQAIVWGFLGIVAALIALAIGVVAGCLTTGCTASQFLAVVAAAALGWSVWMAGKASYTAAVDPDEGYEEVPTPEFRTPESVAEMPDGPEKDLAVSSLRFSSFVEASSIAMARYYSAVEHYSAEIALKQLTAADKYLSEANSEMQKVRESYGLMSRGLPSLDETAVDRAMTYLEPGRFPEKIQKLLDELGDVHFRENVLAFTQNASEIASVVIPSIEVEKALESTLSSVSDQRNLLEHLISTLQRPGVFAEVLPYLYLAIPVILAIVAVYAIRRHTFARGKKAGETRFCIHCGASLRPRARYCIKCGAERRVPLPRRDPGAGTRT